MTNEDREALIDWCTEGGMSPEWTEVAERCIDWMNKVIDFHMDVTYGKPDGDHLEAIEDAEFIIDCINLYLSI